jgi:hypothetical protein
MMFGLPAPVVLGLCVGGSCALGIVKELPDDSKTVQQLFKTNQRAAIVSTAVSISVGVFCGPVAGVISEMITYPFSLVKVRKVRKYIERTEAPETPKLLMSQASKVVHNNLSTIQLRTILSHGR